MSDTQTNTWVDDTLIDSRDYVKIMEQDLEAEANEDNPFYGFDPRDDEYDEWHYWTFMDESWIRKMHATIDHVSDSFFGQGKGKYARPNITPSALYDLHMM